MSNDLSNKEYLGLKALSKRLECVFYKWRVPGDLEDFISNYNMDIRSGYRQHQTLDQYAVDYMRDYYGRKGQKVAVKQAVELDESLGLEVKEYSSSYFNVMSLLDTYEGRERQMLVLYVLHSMTFKEIGFVFARSDCWVFQILTPVLEGLRQRIEAGL
jgi:hypothetical protein